MLGYLGVMKALGVNTSVDSKLKSVAYRVVKLKVYTGIENVSTNIVPFLSLQKMIPALIPVQLPFSEGTVKQQLCVSKLNLTAHLRWALLLFPTSFKNMSQFELMIQNNQKKNKK